jgi:hypothetical protein
MRLNKKYGARLSSTATGSWLNDASKKVIWLKAKDDITELRGSYMQLVRQSQC